MISQYRKGTGINMINFEEELKNFKPSLEVEEAEQAIYNHELTEIGNLDRPILARQPDGIGSLESGRDSVMNIVRKHLGVNPDMTQSSGNRGPAVRPDPKRHLGHAGD